MTSTVRSERFDPFMKRQIEYEGIIYMCMKTRTPCVVFQRGNFFQKFSLVECMPFIWITVTLLVAAFRCSLSWNVLLSRHLKSALNIAAVNANLSALKNLQETNFWTPLHHAICWGCAVSPEIYDYTRLHHKLNKEKIFRKKFNVSQTDIEI